METGGTIASEESSLDVVDKDEILIVILFFLGLIGPIVVFIHVSHAGLLFILLMLLRLLIMQTLSILFVGSGWIGLDWYVRITFLSIFQVYREYIVSIFHIRKIYEKYKGKTSLFALLQLEVQFRIRTATKFIQLP